MFLGSQFKGTIPVDFFLLGIRFYAIMHITTIVQNKIITYLFLPFFVRLIFIGLVLASCPLGD